MDRFCIITNRPKDPDYEVTARIESYLKEHGKSCVNMHQVRDPLTHHHYTDAKEIPEGTECVIVLGGDGTLMRAARNIVERQIPIIGINLGTLGYLAEIDKESIIPALDCLMEDKFTIERRMMLKGKVMHREQEIGRGIALNDIVISRNGGLHVVPLKNYVNGTYLNSYRADGVILSTPTGSTGYSLSAGGPIISPAANLILLTPLAAHTLNTRSVVLPAESLITVEIGQNRDDTVEKTSVFFDGLTEYPMVTGDTVEISRFEQDALIVKIHHDSFLETLRRKMTV
ncbi:MAG: NAD(+)/NADH kinase [Eubacterium sp.]|nr:NAD(+)/NADH kinase [Eubacterium sp.]